MDNEEELEEELEKELDDYLISLIAADIEATYIPPTEWVVLEAGPVHYGCKESNLLPRKKPSTDV